MDSQVLFTYFVTDGFLEYHCSWLVFLACFTVWNMPKMATAFTPCTSSSSMWPWWRVLPDPQHSSGKTSPDRASSSPGFLITQFILLSFHFILIFLQLEILTLVTVGWMFDILTNDTQNWVFATDWIVYHHPPPQQSSYVEALNSNVIVFGARALRR